MKKLIKKILVDKKMRKVTAVSSLVFTLAAIGSPWKD